MFVELEMCDGIYCNDNDIEVMANVLVSRINDIKKYKMNMNKNTKNIFSNNSVIGLDTLASVSIFICKHVVTNC